LISPVFGGCAAGAAECQKQWKSGMANVLQELATWLHDVFVKQFDTWILLGFVAQFFFSMRFVVQWVASEKAKRSVVPIAFWFFSLFGGSLLLIYAIQRQDPVFIAGQALGLFIYIRNLWLIANERKAAMTKVD
jgi:lipid-A-disaccharide synthase-like uncharacterized protein